MSLASEKPDKPQVFISWSGSLGKAIAKVLSRWVSDVVAEARPWMSSNDVPSGTVFMNRIADNLRASDYGVIVVTPEALRSQWVLFEAGAIAGHLESRVTPLLVGFDSAADLVGPLSHFHAVKLDREGLSRLLVSICESLHIPLSPAQSRLELVETMYDKFFRDATEAAGDPSAPKRLLGDQLEDLVSLVRTVLANQLSASQHMSYAGLQDTLARKLRLYEVAYDSIELIPPMPGWNFPRAVVGLTPIGELATTSQIALKCYDVAYTSRTEWDLAVMFTYPEDDALFGEVVGWLANVNTWHESSKPSTPPD